jgi:putative peptidoglycan lipid II flippase
VVLLSAILMRRGHMALDEQFGRRLPRMVLAGSAMVVVLWSLERTFYAALDTGAVRGLRWVGLAVMVSAGMAAYAAAGQLLGAFDLRAVAVSVLRRLRKTTPAPQGS